MEDRHVIPPVQPRANYRPVPARAGTWREYLVPGRGGGMIVVVAARIGIGHDGEPVGRNAVAGASWIDRPERSEDR